MTIEVDHFVHSVILSGLITDEEITRHLEELSELPGDAASVAESLVKADLLTPF